MTSEEKFIYWLDIAQYDLETAQAMYDTGRWLYVVFMCQQSIEKLVKGLYTLYNDDEPPRSHNINFLIRKIEYKLPSPVSENYLLLFQKLTIHYIERRYPEYKEKLSWALTDKTAGLILDDTKEAFKWLLTLKP